MKIKLSLYCYRYVIVIFFVTLLGACTDITKAPPMSDYELATQYMSDQQYSSAIVLLEGRLRQFPSDQQAKFLMAAAYAGRAGILISQFIDVGSELNRLLNPGRSRQPIPVSIYKQLRNRTTQAEQIKVLENLDQIHSILLETENFLQFFDRLPKLSTPQSVEDVEAALLILNQIEDLEKGRLIYRGLIKLILLKYMLNHMKWLPALVSADFCHINHQQMNKDIQFLQINLQDILLDLVIGREAPDESMRKTQEIKQFIQNTFDPIADFIVLHNSSSQILNEIAKQVGQVCVIK